MTLRSRCRASMFPEAPGQGRDEWGPGGLASPSVQLDTAALWDSGNHTSPPGLPSAELLGNPSTQNVLPGIMASEHEDPFFCVLKDM